MGKRIIRQNNGRDALRIYRRLLPAALLFLLVFFAPLLSKAGEEPEEIAVFFNVQKKGVYLPALLQEETLYLPVGDVFDFLKINNQVSPGFETVSGYLIHPKDAFLIDDAHKTISYNETTVTLTEDELIRTTTNLYLRSDYFGKIFGLECLFAFRSLTVVLKTKLDIPLLRDQRQQLLRDNLKKVQGEIKPDTIIRQQHPFFRLGMADWSVVHSKTLNTGSNTRLNVKMGGLIAGGEAVASLNYDDSRPLREQQQFYQWRYVNNNLCALRQVIIGNIAPQATSSLFVPVAGVQLTNTPTTRRRSFGTYPLSDYTRPGWMVELYVNNSLVDYVKADASGFYTFQVPLVYGNTTVRLKFYGPSGEESTEEKTIRIPFNFLPANTLEYTLSAGVLKDSSGSRFSRTTLLYGFGPCLTVGSGMEYLSSVRTGSSMPFFTTSLRLATTTLLSFEYTHHVRLKSTLTYRLPSQLQLELNYIKYTKGQKAILNNYLEDRQLILTGAIRAQKLLLHTRVGIRQVIAPATGSDSLAGKKYSEVQKTKLTTAEAVLSATVYRFSANLTTYAYLKEAVYPALHSNFSLAYRTRPGFVFRSLHQFSYTQQKFITSKYEIEKQWSNNGFTSLSFEKNYALQTSTFTLGLRYDFSFIRTAFSVLRSNKATTLVQAASGSLLYDPSTAYLKAGSRSQAGRGGILLSPFLDLNANGRRDENEPGVRGLKFRMTSGRAYRNEEGNLIRVTGLEPYINHPIELDDHGLGNIAWQIKHKKMSVAVEPNSFKLVEIPVAVLGEVSGMVYLNQHNEQKGLATLRINFYDSSSKLVAYTISESDGFFDFLGLPAGVYTAKIDPVQLEKLQLQPSQTSLSFSMERSREGSVVSGLAFSLQPISRGSISLPEKEVKASKQ